SPALEHRRHRLLVREGGLRFCEQFSGGCVIVVHRRSVGMGDHEPDRVSKRADGAAVHSGWEPFSGEQCWEVGVVAVLINAELNRADTYYHFPWNGFSPR